MFYVLRVCLGKIFWVKHFMPLGEFAAAREAFGSRVTRSSSPQTFLMMLFILQALVCISHLLLIEAAAATASLYVLTLIVWSFLCLFPFLSFMIHSQSHQHSENRVLDMRHWHFICKTHNIYFQSWELLKANHPLPLWVCLPSKADCVCTSCTWFKASRQLLCIEYAISSEGAKETADYFYIFNGSQ